MFREQIYDWLLAIIFHSVNYIKAINNALKYGNCPCVNKVSSNTKRTIKGCVPSQYSTVLWYCMRDHTYVQCGKFYLHLRFSEINFYFLSTLFAVPKFWLYDVWIWGFIVSPFTQPTEGNKAWIFFKWLMEILTPFAQRSVENSRFMHFMRKQKKWILITFFCIGQYVGMANTSLLESFRWYQNIERKSPFWAIFHSRRKQPVKGQHTCTTTLPPSISYSQ